MSDDVPGIASLNRLFQRFCSTQSNEGGRLSMAKTQFSEAMWWLRLNDEKRREREMMNQREIERREEAVNG